MRTEDTTKKFRRWPPRVKRRRPRNLPVQPPPEEAESQASERPVSTDKPVRISYRSRRLPTDDNGNT